MQAFLRSMIKLSMPEVQAVMEPKNIDGADFTFRLCEGLFIGKKA
jgi:hypothetical protein